MRREKGTRIVVELASLTMAMAMSITTRCADVIDLPLWQITHSGQSERISAGSPVGTSPMAHGMTPSRLDHEAWRLNSKRKRFSSQFWLGGSAETSACGWAKTKINHTQFWLGRVFPLQNTGICQSPQRQLIPNILLMPQALFNIAPQLRELQDAVH